MPHPTLKIVNRKTSVSRAAVSKVIAEIYSQDPALSQSVARSRKAKAASTVSKSSLRKK